jgi:hypothetical protein
MNGFGNKNKQDTVLESDVWSESVRRNSVFNNLAKGLKNKVKIGVAD